MSSTNKPFFLPIAVAASSAYDAYENGTLGFQNDRTDCLYHYNPNSHTTHSRPLTCAIGAALPQGLVPEGFDISTHIAAGFIETDDAQALSLLQALHDAACISGHRNDTRIFVWFLERLMQETQLAGSFGNNPNYEFAGHEDSQPNAI
jgi:hypothetical protein